jgi:hypothetical protein
MPCPRGVFSKPSPSDARIKVLNLSCPFVGGVLQAKDGRYWIMRLVHRKIYMTSHVTITVGSDGTDVL